LGLETVFAGIKLRNPTVLASGILGTNFKLMRRIFLEGGAGAITMKSIGPKERAGHANPCVVEWDQGLLNAVGLPSPGIENMEQEWKELEKRDFPLIASIYGASAEEFAEVAKFVASKKPDAIEVNISCPNTKKEGMVFGVCEEASAEVVEAVKRQIGSIPLVAKLTPQAPNIAAIAANCEKAGADAICAINTVAGMAIDIDARKPVLANKFGGLSGPAIRPVGVKCVYQIFEAVKIPILGMGGICTGRDAIEFVMAGATAIGIGSGVYYRGIDVFKKVCGEMGQWMEENRVESLKEIRGCAHE
jgi:dihydroorotate dehydrogenase (NAD+) catalytic subunit